MFDKSDGVYELGRKTSGLISEWVDKGRKGEMGWWQGDPEVVKKEKEKRPGSDEEKDERLV